MKLENLSRDKLMKLNLIKPRKNLSSPSKRIINNNSTHTIMDNFIGLSLDYGFGIFLVILSN